MQPAVRRVHRNRLQSAKPKRDTAKYIPQLHSNTMQRQENHFTHLSSPLTHTTLSLEKGASPNFGETLLELISYIWTPTNCSSPQNHFTPLYCSLTQTGAVTKTIPEKLAGAPGKVQFSLLRARRPGKSWPRERGHVLESVAVPTVSKYPEITQKLLSFFLQLEVFSPFSKLSVVVWPRGDDVLSDLVMLVCYVKLLNIFCSISFQFCTL